MACISKRQFVYFLVITPGKSFGSRWPSRLNLTDAPISACYFISSGVLIYYTFSYFKCNSHLLRIQMRRRMIRGSHAPWSNRRGQNSSHHLDIYLQTSNAFIFRRAQVKNKFRNSLNDYELADYVIHKFKNVVGMGDDQFGARGEGHVTYVEGKNTLIHVSIVL